MIDNYSLDTVFVAQQAPEFDNSPMPEGEYSLRIKTIEAWKATTKNIKVIKRDVNGNAIKDETGKNITELVNNCTFYNAKVIYEVIEDPKYNGRLIYDNITTHPNMPWSVPSFLHACGKKQLKASQIQQECSGSKVNAKVKVGSYDKEITDQETGITKTESRTKNEIERLKPYTFLGKVAPSTDVVPTFDINADDLPF